MKDIGKRVWRRVRVEARRPFSNPFADPDAKRLIVHGCYHRTGTIWFSRVLRAVGVEFGLRFQRGAQKNLRPWTDLFVQPHSRVEVERLPAYVGSHIIRDPRDMIVSGYFYHLWTTEQWAHLPRPEHGGRSYQEYLNSLDRHDGLLAEIQNTAPRVRRMLEWDYDNPRFLELKYEDVIENEEAAFTEVFDKYGFNEKSIERSVQIAAGFSFTRQTGRSIGAVQEGSHTRSGRSGQWMEYFDQEHKAAFVETLGDALIQLGYEESNDW